MDANGGSKDESSIGPVSSLRSRFEQLGTKSPSPARSPLLPPALPEAHVKSNKPLVDTSWPPRMIGELDQTDTPLHLARQGSPHRARPLSIADASPSRRPPPLLTVDSPYSPERRHPLPLSLGSSALPDALPMSSGAYSPTRLTAPPPLRTPSPALEARMNALLLATGAPQAILNGSGNASWTASLKSKTPLHTIPPPVNRAGKPQIPPKSTGQLKKPDTLFAPDTSTDLTDHSASPFSTPPNSGTTSPHPRNGPTFRKDTPASGSSEEQRPRQESDASFVERVRTNSAASALQRTRGDSNSSFISRARAGSNASFVEPSSLPDNWPHPSTPPPLQKFAATNPEHQMKPSSVPIPARYQSAAAQSSGNGDHLLQDPSRLPVRPELQIRSGGTSPKKLRSGRNSPEKEIYSKRSFDGVKRAATFDVQTPNRRIPAAKPVQRSALMLGFDRATPPATDKTSQAPPAVPAPRRSIDRRRELPPTVSTPINDGSHDHIEESLMRNLDASPVTTTTANDYPDSSQASRRPPKFKGRPWHIPTDYDTRTFAVCGEYVCTTGHRTKAWSLRTGEQLLDMEHHEIVKVSSLVFKPSASPEHEGKRIWLGTSIGEIHELDIPSQSILRTQSGAHPRKDIIRMFRYASELWTLDDGGDLKVWKPDHKGMASLDSHFNSFRVPKGHTFSIALGYHLWIATGKEIRVFAPSSQSSADFQVLSHPLSQPGTAEVYSGTTLSGQPDLVCFGHSDGKVSIYHRRNFSCTAVVNVSLYKITSLAGVGEYLWAGFNTGMVYVYDTSTTPWTVKKDWQAHEKQICGINAERSSVWKMGRLQAVTLGTDNVLRIWDGFLEEDWLDTLTQKRDSEYCTFREMKASVLTWNAGASKPMHLERNRDDDKFLRDYMTSHDPPDIFVFGFQELVDLENKKLTAKTLFKGSKKKDANEQEHMSHQYRAWRDHLTKCLDEYMPASQTYVLLSTASLVGLFTCVFVKASIRSRIKHVQGIEVKRGMGGIYGNKGALVLRLILDDTSLCFVNCHLAAGQTETIHRNNDIAAILESDDLPSYPLESDSEAQHSDVFPTGGNGSMILDHEICILSGDLNYRIDTMGRDTVVKHIQQNNLWRLLERDQLLLSRKKNPGFRLRAFQESEIRFAPTYKYNVHSDEYDTSEKRRSPAWCDRILYRGLGKVRMEEYRRWEVRVSDHRPVSGRLRLRVKTVDGAKRVKVAQACQAEFEQMRRKVSNAVQLEYLTDVLGLSRKEATAALRV